MSTIIDKTPYYNLHIGSTTSSGYQDTIHQALQSQLQPEQQLSTLYSSHFSRFKQLNNSDDSDQQQPPPSLIAFNDGSHVYNTITKEQMVDSIDEAIIQSHLDQPLPS